VKIKQKLPKEVLIAVNRFLSLPRGKGAILQAI
jgi:hypothetical protein